MQHREQQIDYILLTILGCLFIFSLIAVYSGSGQYTLDDSFFFVKRQVIWYIIGIIIMFGIAYFDFELLDRVAIYLYTVGVGLLLVVHFFGTTKNGSQRWIDLGIFDLQPSEFIKIFLILQLGVLLSKIGENRIAFLASIPVTLKIALYSTIPFLLILIQPDLGSALMIAAIAASMILVSSISFKMIGLLLASGVGMILSLILLFQYNFELFSKIFKPHQMGRIYGWLSPNEYASDYGYQLKQAITGIGAGQLTGAGFNQGVQVQSGKVPEAHTDFIFAVIGEDFGFIGASILITLYFILIYRIIAIALRSNSLFGVYICIGAVGLFGFQVFQNIAMTVGLMPITGLPLPLISYGGSALLTNFIALGLVLSVQIRSRDYMFSDNN
ncbi:rod shape-determining protein RodA [Ornithinibacillus sp. L9]|uniref:Rod shape-determining protein RodA n=1 Tax=Ornithinibacillus caprae TaxID=2678566 RepID=A0A6N8FMH9_9BACI|nr:rod shape-determining protein RodA [Ornithinibacillus caprae]MUK90381.1 rod shape-determining protein RodA [Ornithinibacillus caprae]